MILDTGNFTDVTARSGHWVAETTLSTWSRILQIDGYASVLLNIEFGGENEASCHTYLVSTGWNCARIVQIGNNGFWSYYGAQLRVTHVSSTTYYVEVYHTYNAAGNPDTHNCRFLLLSRWGTVTPITTATSGGGNVDSSLYSDNTIAANFNADMVDGLHGSSLVRGGAIDYSPDMASWLPGYPSFVGSAYNTNYGSWWNLISVRHRNGSSDGDRFGMYICASLNTGDNNLCWNK
jgi:hypothetical protein